MHSEILSLLINCPPHCELNASGRVSHCERWDVEAHWTFFIPLPLSALSSHSSFLHQWWFPPQMSLDLDCMPDLDGESESLRLELILFPPSYHYQFKQGNSCNIQKQKLSFVRADLRSLVMIYDHMETHHILWSYGNSYDHMENHHKLWSYGNPCYHMDTLVSISYGNPPGMRTSRCLGRGFLQGFFYLDLKTWQI